MSTDVLPVAAMDTRTLHVSHDKMRAWWGDQLCMGSKRSYERFAEVTEIEWLRQYAGTTKVGDYVRA